MRSFRLGCQEVARIEAARLWVFVGLASGGIGVYLLQVLASNRDIQEWIRIAASIAAEPWAWSLLAVIGAVVTYQVSERQLRPLRRALISDEHRIENQLDISRLASSATPSHTTAAGSPDLEAAPIVKAMARFVLGNEAPFNFYDDSVDIYEWSDGWKHLDQAIANMDSRQVWNLLSTPQALRLIRGLPRRFLREALRRERSLDQAYHAEPLRYDLRLRHLPSGRITAEWDSELLASPSEGEPLCLHPSWTAFDLDIKEALTTLGLNLNLVRLQVHEGLSQRGPLFLSQLEFSLPSPTESPKVTVRSWNELSGQEKHQLITFTMGRYASGLAQIRGGWSGEDVTTDGDPGEILNQLKQNDAYIYDPSLALDNNASQSACPVDDTYIPINESFELKRFCLLRPGLEVDTELLVAVQRLFPVVTTLHVIDAGRRPIPLCVGEHGDSLYYLSESFELVSELDEN